MHRFHTTRGSVITQTSMPSTTKVDALLARHKAALQYLYARINYERIPKLPYHDRCFKLERMQELVDRLLEGITFRRYPADGINPTQVAAIRQLKGRMERERTRRGAATENLKLGPGGLSDIEWTVQLLQLQHAGQMPKLRDIQASRSQSSGGQPTTPLSRTLLMRSSRKVNGGSSRSGILPSR